ncbi:protein SCAR2-like isoform X2 [Miscanthus floridulus]|uniref:protein SCAR2-like isoform X2 n=1 Tax=Miscanthus floridulus TaxID=154761 RepID=UPI003458A41A
MGLSSRCGCRCECVTTTTTHGDVVRNRNNDVAPDAVLEGLAVAGLVAILRQLGDLAELAAEVFDDMQDQVMAASARGRRLAVRAKLLLEADLDLPPPKSTHNSAAALNFTTSSSGRLGCRAHVRGGVGGGTPPMPRLVVQRIRRCRGPPRLSLLDKFDAAGEGACLKRYTDPSFFFRAHSARLEQGTLRVRANRGPYLKSMSMETRPKIQIALNSEPPESAHTVTDCKSEIETETETDASEAPSPGFLSMLRQLKKQHRQAAGAGSLFRMQQAVDRVQSSPQLNTEKKLQGGGTAQPSPSELERTSSFEAWLAPDARRLTTATHHHEHDEIITQEPPHPHGASATTCSGSVSDVVTTSIGALSSSTMLKAKQNSEDAEIPCSKSSSKRSRSSVEMIASRVSSLPRKLFMNIKHHNDCSRSDPAGTSLRMSQAQATGIGDCSPELEAVPTPREAFLPILVHSDPVYSSIHSLLPENDKCSYLQHHESLSCNASVDAERHHQQEDPSADKCSNSNSSTPETIGDPTCTTPDSKNLLLPGSLVLKRAGALPENPCSEDAKADTTPPLPPIPPMQWLSERGHTGTRAPSPKHRALWKKSLEVTEMIQAIRQAHSHSIQSSPVDTEETLDSNEHTSANASHRDEMKCSEETRHPHLFRVREDAVQASEGIVLKAGEFPVPAILSDEAWSEIDVRTQAQADTCFQQQGRQQFGSGHSDHGSTEKRSEEHEASDSSSNLQNESVFFSAVQELAKMSPPPSVPRPKYSLLDAGSHGRIMLRNGPSLIHPSRNILDSRSVLIKQIKDIAMAGNPSFKLKPVSGASSPQSPVTGSPANSKVATILQRADDIRQAHADSNDVDSEESWSDNSE